MTDGGLRGTVADTVLAEWCALLEVDRAADDDEFFSLGGNSLLALTLATRIEERLDIRFPLEALFFDGTFGAVVGACVAARATGQGTDAG
jgi:acyl carrier protein